MSFIPAMTMLTENNIAKLPFYGLLKISGPDAKAFLQGQITCHMEKIPINGRLAAHCNPQGRIISLFHIVMMQDDYLLCLPKNMLTIAISALKKYAVFYKVSLTDVSEDYHLIISHEPIPTLTNIRVTPSFNLSITEAPDTNEISQQAWKQHLISAKIPTVYAETSGKFLPHELNLIELGAVDFDKGCYTGQEIIARMHYRGKVRIQLCNAVITGSDFQLGDDILFASPQGHKAIGQLVDSCELDYHQHQALVTITQEELHHSLFIQHEKNMVSIVNERKI
jgi:tRNA-modifying protein YgfZ